MILIPSLLLSLALAGTPSDTVAAADIRAAYGALIRVDAIAPPGTMDSMLVLHIVAPPAGQLLSSFFQDHPLWFSYLIQNGRGFELPHLDGVAPGVSAAARGHPSLAALQAEFVRRLATDSLFNSVAVPAIAEHLRRAGIPVAAALAPLPRLAIPLDNAMRVVVRFFYPDLLIKDRIASHICSVINAVRQLPSRNLALEALAFSAITRDIMLGDSARIRRDFDPAQRLMGALDAPGPKEQRLQRAQGMMWALMMGSARLREVLLAEAERQSDVVQFQLVTP
ncbi:MAG: hypothetical protein ACYC7F_03265 [Gemmatimonadaceae bacterium]